MVYEAGPPVVLDQLISQPFRIISVFLDTPCFGLHLCLLLEAVVSESALSGGGFFFYDTTLTVWLVQPSPSVRLVTKLRVL